MVAYKAVGGGLQGSSYQEGLPRFGHALFWLCDICLYIQVFPTVLHLVVAYESMQVIPLFSTSSPKNSVKGTGSYYIKSPIDDLQALVANTLMKAKEGQAAQNVS